MEFFNEKEMKDVLKTWPYNLINRILSKCNNPIDGIDYKIEDVNLSKLGTTIDFVLSERNRNILILYFKYGLSYEKIGNQYFVSREKIRGDIDLSLRKLGCRYRNFISTSSLSDDIQMSEKMNVIIHESLILKNKLAALKGEDLDLDSVKNINILEIPMSRRTYNCLYRANIKTLGDISNMDIIELHAIRNLGLVSMEEIFELLHKYSLDLKPVDDQDIFELICPERVKEIYYNVFKKNPWEE